MKTSIDSKLKGLRVCRATANILPGVPAAVLDLLDLLLDLAEEQNRRWKRNDAIERIWRETWELATDPDATGLLNPADIVTFIQRRMVEEGVWQR